MLIQTTRTRFTVDRAALVVFLLATAVVASACAETNARNREFERKREFEPPAAKASASQHSQAPTRSTIYFLTDGGAVPLGVRRDLTRRPGVRTARLALEELVAGPTAADRRNGLTTAIPAATEIRALTLDIRPTGTDARVDLSGLPAGPFAGSLLKLRVRTQIARTLIGLNSIERVWLRVDGRPWGLWDMQGNIRDDPIDYAGLQGIFHVCTAKPGTEAVAGDCFTALP